VATAEAKSAFCHDKNDEEFGHVGGTLKPTESPLIDITDSKTPPCDYDDGEFGAFGEAPTGTRTNKSDIHQAAPTSMDSQTPACDVEKDAEFGDFRVAPTGTNTADNQNAVPERNDSRFPAFDEGVAQTASHKEFPDSLDSQAPFSDKDDDGEFGDFGVAPTVTNMADTPTAKPESMDAQTPAEDAEFGDFGVAPTAKNTADIHKGSVSDDDDEFGDFGEAATDKSNSDSRQAAPDCIDYQSDDCEEDDDKFGDFGVATTNKTSKQVDDEDDGKDGEFGDLGQASSLVVHNSEVSAEGDEFGEFSSLDVVDVMQPKLASTPSKVNEHPLLEKAHLVCSYIFDQKSNAEDSEKDHEEDSVWTNGVSITEVLTSLLKRQTSTSQLTRSSDDLLTAVWRHEELVWKRAPPRTIVSRDSRGPYAHFSLPLRCIDSQTPLISGNGRKRAKRLTVTSLPEVLNIRLPSPASKAIARPSLHENSMSNPASLPSQPLRASSKSNHISQFSLGVQATNDAVNFPGPTLETFSNRIPDLSFMLSSALQNPIKK